MIHGVNPFTLLHKIIFFLDCLKFIFNFRLEGNYLTCFVIQVSKGIDLFHLLMIICFLDYLKFFSTNLSRTVRHPVAGIFNFLKNPGILLKDEDREKMNIRKAVG